MASKTRCAQSLLKAFTASQRLTYEGSHRLLSPKELFAPETLESFKI